MRLRVQTTSRSVRIAPVLCLGSDRRPRGRSKPKAALFPYTARQLGLNSLHRRGGNAARMGAITPDSLRSWHNQHAPAAWLLVFCVNSVRRVDPICPNDYPWTLVSDGALSWRF